VRSQGTAYFQVLCHSMSIQDISSTSPAGTVRDTIESKCQGTLYMTFGYQGLYPGSGAQIAFKRIICGMSSKEQTEEDSTIVVQLAGSISSTTLNNPQIYIHFKILLPLNSEKYRMSTFDLAQKFREVFDHLYFTTLPLIIMRI
jgi:hypothetical protein